MLNKAIEIATKAHVGQVDKSGNPCILHPLRVMLACESEIERICAVLHDVIEDIPITLEDIKKQGFSDEKFRYGGNAHGTQRNQRFNYEQPYKARLSS